MHFLNDHSLIFPFMVHGFSHSRVFPLVNTIFQVVSRSIRITLNERLSYTYIDVDYGKIISMWKLYNMQSRLSEYWLTFLMCGFSSKKKENWELSCFSSLQNAFYRCCKPENCDPLLAILPWSHLVAIENYKTLISQCDYYDNPTVTNRMGRTSTWPSTEQRTQ